MKPSFIIVMVTGSIPSSATSSFAVSWRTLSRRSSPLLRVYLLLFEAVKFNSFLRFRSRTPTGTCDSFRAQQRRPVWSERGTCEDRAIEREEDGGIASGRTAHIETGPSKILKGRLTGCLALSRNRLRLCRVLGLMSNKTRLQDRVSRRGWLRTEIRRIHRYGNFPRGERCRKMSFEEQA